MISIKKVKSSEFLLGVATTTILQGTAKIVAVITTLYCSNVLIPDDFGTYSYIKNTLNVIVLMCATNFSSLFTKFAAESLTSDISVKRLYVLFFFILIVSGGAGIIVCALPNEIVLNFFDDSIFCYLKVIALLLPIYIMQPMITGVFSGYKEFSLAGKYELLSSVFLLLSLIIGVNTSQGKGAIIAILICYAISSIVGVLMLINYNRKKNVLKKVTNLIDEWRVVPVMILPMFFMSFVEAPILFIGQTIVARYDSYTSVGLLSVIIQIRNVFFLLPSYIFQTFIPFVTELNQQKRYEEYFGRFLKLSLFLIPIMLILVFILIPFASPLLSIFNNSFTNGTTAFMIGISILPLMIAQVLLKVNMIVREHQKEMFFMSSVTCLTMLAFMFFLVQMGVKPVESFFYAQLFYYISQISISLFIFLKDRTLCIGSISNNCTKKK